MNNLQKPYQITFILFVFGAFCSLFLTIFLSLNPLQGDNQNYAMVARSILSENNINLNEFSERIKDGYGIIKIQDSFYNFFPLGPSLLLTPFYAVTNFVIHTDAYTKELIAGKLVVSFCYAISLSLFFLIVYKLTNRNIIKSLILCFIFGFCSHQFSQNIAQFWSHAAAMPFIIASLLFLLPTNKSYTIWAGIFVFFGYLMRPTVVLLVPVTVVYLFIYDKKRLKKFLIGCLYAGFVLILINLYYHNSIIAPYSQISRLGSNTFFIALIGNLFSPNRGLFVFMPWTIFSFAVGLAVFFNKKISPLYRMLFCVVILHIIVVSSLPHWWAGHSYGPRFLTIIMPELVLLLIPLLNNVIYSQNYIKFIFALFILFSFAVQGGVYKGYSWNINPQNVDTHPERIWDWSDMQIFRVLKK